jgi:ribokinase
MIEAAFTLEPSIAVIGSSMMDLTCYAESLPQAGETVFGELFTTGFGGKGANQAVMAQRAGAQVYMIGKVGHDLFGKSIRENFSDQGLYANFLETSSLATGVAHIWVDKKGENRIIIVPGANHDIDPAVASRAIATLSSATIVIGQCELEQEVTLAAFHAAKQRGATTILNPAPYQHLSADLMEHTDWLIPNEIEFSQIHAQHLLPYNDEIIASLRPGQSAVITLGAAGAALVDSAGVVTRIPSPKVKAVDSTGAGDCFIGTFAASLLLGHDPKSAVEIGCAAASISVTRKGAQSSYPTKNEMAEIVNRVSLS